MGEKELEAEETLWRNAHSAAAMNKETSASRVIQTLKRKLQRAVLRAKADLAVLAFFGIMSDGDPGQGVTYRACTDMRQLTGHFSA